jgi:hypothetical protein
VVGGDGVDVVLRFRLEMGGDGVKYCWKIKWWQRAHLDSMERKRGTVRWHDDVDRRRGNTGEGTRGNDVSWADMNLTGPKNKELTRSIQLL